MSSLITYSDSYIVPKIYFYGGVYSIGIVAIALTVGIACFFGALALTVAILAAKR